MSLHNKVSVSGFLSALFYFPFTVPTVAERLQKLHHTVCVCVCCFVLSVSTVQVSNNFSSCLCIRDFWCVRTFLSCFGSPDISFCSSSRIIRLAFSVYSLSFLLSSHSSLSLSHTHTHTHTHTLEQHPVKTLIKISLSQPCIDMHWYGVILLLFTFLSALPRHLVRLSEEE